MSEKQTTLAYTLDGVEVTLTIVRATARIGVARYLLMSEGYKENESETDMALKALRTMLYPDCISCTMDVTGIEFPIPFEQFAELPEEFVNAWADAVYRINPHWRPGAGETANAPLPKPSKRSKKG